MNKKVIILLVILLLLYFVTKAQKPQPPIDLGSNIYSGKFKWTYYRVKLGDTLYKIALANIPMDKAKERFKGVNIPTPDGTFVPMTEKDIVLSYAQDLAWANGFDWALFDSKPTSELKDPDTLKVGQKLIVWSWESFSQNDNTGFLLPYSQYNKFDSWEVLDDSVEGMKEAFANFPPKSL